ncbi:hypothetical protein KSP40_PGU006123 [Platanthera guangdongensis]|uniref:Uncharacterized protein n=1 Tax=Platanthera guangdongensis TaxID=2320717 RepID=A0ABR2MSZ1_9ASPA
MPYRGSRNEAVDDFDGYDPTPYSGGYDITLTYGRPLQPSVEICYPVSRTEGVDFDRPQHPSGSPTSAIAANPIREGDCYGILRPGFRPPPQPATNTSYPGYGYQSYGHQGIGGPAFAGVSDYGSSNYGSGYDGRPQHQKYGSEYQSGYGRPEGSFGYGSGGYPMSNEGGEYRKGGENAGGGYRRHGDGVYEGNSSYQRPNYGVGHEQSGRYGNLGYVEQGSGGYNKPSYTNEEQRLGYKKPSYYRAEAGEEYGSSKYVR